MFKYFQCLDHFARLWCIDSGQCHLKYAGHVGSGISTFMYFTQYGNVIQNPIHSNFHIADIMWICDANVISIEWISLFFPVFAG
jgi:hypothetical protein